MLYKELKEKTAKRLKELRIEKGFTYYSLAKAINERYGGKSITQTTLKYLEIADPEQNPKLYEKGFGVKVSTLLMLADFYNVSVQYLIGTTDTRASTDDMETAVKVTGLSEKSINALNMFPSEIAVLADSINIVFAKMEHLKTYMIMNDILEHGTGLITRIAQLLYVEDLDIHENDKMTIDGIEYSFPTISEAKFYGYMEMLKGHIQTLRGIIQNERQGTKGKKGGRK